MPQRTLQKSFSEQDHSNSKPRKAWRRTNTYHGDSKSKPEKEKVLPLMPLSSTTKNKLSTFVHKPATSVPDSRNAEFRACLEQQLGDKENDTSNHTLAREEEMVKVPASTGREIAAQLPVSLPSTPSEKLNIPNLFDMADVKRVHQSVSPEDKVLWDVKDYASTLGSRSRPLKRARSSSPPAVSVTISSSQLRSGPEHDVWHSTTLILPDFEQIMNTSSPRRVPTPRTASRLTRTQSLGNQSIQPNKRRKCTSIAQNPRAAVDHAGSIKLTTFMESLQRDLTAACAPKPITMRRSSIPGTDSSPSTTDQSMPPEDDVAPPPRSQQPSTKSDYGSDDSMDLLHDHCAPVDTIASMHAGDSATVDLVLPPQQQKEIEATVNAVSSVSIVDSAACNGEKDEFDEFDDGYDDIDFDTVLLQTNMVNAGTSTMISNPSTTTMPPAPALATIVDDHDDEFGDDIDDADLEAAEIAATQALHSSRASFTYSQKKEKIQRYLITHIVESEYEATFGRLQKEKILLLQHEETKSSRSVHLRGSWLDTPATVRAYVHVIGVFEANGACVVDDQRHLIILHPDHLISSTVVADSFSCTRRAVLQDRIKATSENSPSLVYGTILHEIFQSAMLHNRWDSGWLEDQIEVIAQQHLEELYSIKTEMSAAVAHLRSKMTELQNWAELFVRSRPDSRAMVRATNGESANMCITKLLDVEEHVWSPMYGLKGNIDATVQVTMRDGPNSRVLTVPFEVKTGKTANAAHRAQTALYNLLLSDRYDIEVAYGILYYMETSETIRIPAIRHELKHMIMQRNELACFVRERDNHLPTMLKKENLCNRCYAKTSCFIYHKLVDDGNGETSGLKAKFDEVVNHLTPQHKQFFMKWDDLLTREEKESLKFRRELWTMLGSEREKLGRCFASVVIEPGSTTEETETPKINRYHYTMIKQEATKGFSFLDSQITVGEPIVVSDEQGHFALANGYVVAVRKKRISIAVDRRLHNARIRQPEFDMENNQVFAGIMDVNTGGRHDSKDPGISKEAPIIYRLDKDEFSNGMATVRNNLIQIMAKGPIGSTEIRELVVDLKAPRFKAESTQYNIKDEASLNVDQRQAIQKVMSAQDYALVLGMPGTGKTTTIAHIIRALVSQGKTVLLTSYTHTAVDNILLKLNKDNISMLRLGTAAKINAEVQEFATLAAITKTSFEEIHAAWHNTPVVATTCLGINHALFNERTFDYCIVDEASQITLPVCVGPIRLAKTFILVGDHNQLPPLVQNESARLGGLDVSLFKYLSDAHPASVVYLEHQYRMCADVMALSNKLIYSGRLKCGSQEVANRRLVVPDISALERLHAPDPSSVVGRNEAQAAAKPTCPSSTHPRCWLKQLIRPETTVMFVNTDKLRPDSLESSRGARLVNHVEAKLCTQLVTGLVAVGVLASDIGVMTHYRSQLSVLRDSLQRFPDVEMHTADRFQGRDKEVVVLSLVRSNPEGKIGELLRDWRRINVAFTRAKTKLIVIGSRETLIGCNRESRKPDALTRTANVHNNMQSIQSVPAEGDDEMVSKFVRFMEEQGWIYDLPPGATDMHLFDEEKFTQTQFSGTVTAKQAVMKTDHGGKPKSQPLRPTTRQHGSTDIEDTKENMSVPAKPKVKTYPATAKGRKPLGERDANTSANILPPYTKPSLLSKGSNATPSTTGTRQLQPKKRIQGGRKSAYAPFPPVTQDILDSMSIEDIVDGDPWEYAYDI